MINLIRKINSNVSLTISFFEGLRAGMPGCAISHKSQRSFFCDGIIRSAALLITTLIILNSLSIKNIMKNIETDDLAQIIASQSVLVDFFYHSTLPIKLMNMYLSEYADSATTPLNGTKPDKNDKSTAENTSSDVALLQVSGSMQRVSENLQGRSLWGGDVTDECWHSFNRSAVHRHKTASEGMSCLLICMGCYYFARARSSIDADAAAKKSCVPEYPVCQNIHRVFFCEKFILNTTGRPL